MTENKPEFIDGLIFKPPHENAPPFVKGKLSIKREELMAWLDMRNDEWINIDLKESKSGKWYASVNTWKQKDGWEEKRDEVKSKIGEVPQSTVPPTGYENVPPPQDPNQSTSDMGFDLNDIPF